MSQLTVSPSPHIRSGITTQKIMLDVVIALVPTLIAAGIIFGIRAIALVSICVLSCMVFERFSRFIMKRENTVSDLSAVVTGILLGFNLPVTLPFYVAIIGSFIAIVIVKQLFGGLGQNFANPAITARIVLMLSFPTAMTIWAEPFYYKQADLITGATPLDMIAQGSTELPSMLDMFLGIRGGSLGETCALTLILGGIYLCIRRVISPVTPIAFVGTVALLSLIGGDSVGYQVLAGGLLIGAIFMATDYATTPMNNKGKLIFGLGCGIITYLIRKFANSPEGVSYAILLMNIVTPYIEKLTRSKPFGSNSGKAVQ